MTPQLTPPTMQPAIRMLSDEQIREIHLTTLKIFSEVGVDMQDEQGRALLLEAGAWESNGRIRIPERILVDALASAPSCIPMYNRLGELTMPLELGKVFYGPGSDTLYTLDVKSGERRQSTVQDVENIARLCDALDGLDFIMSMGVPSDVPPDDIYVHSLAAMMRGSIKPIVYTARDREDMEDIYRIACAVVGGEQALREKPFLMLYAEPISPLLIPEESLQKLIFCAEKRIPVAYPPSPNPGGGGPITLAGAVALGSAESLLGLIITQLVNPGTPFLYGMNTAAMDMKTTIVSYGGPEWSLGMAAWCDMARYYNLPVWGYGGATDSKGIDAQAGAEATFSIMSAYLSRCTLVHDVGYIEYGSTSSMEMLVIADEIIQMTRFLNGGVEVSPETLALDVIRQAEPGGGFIADDHTYNHWRTAQFRNRVFDRERQEEWAEHGRRDTFMQANEVARQILSEHQAPPLAEDVEAVIEEVLAERME